MIKNSYLVCVLLGAVSLAQDKPLKTEQGTFDRAIQTKDPAVRSRRLEEFVNTYPASDLNEASRQALVAAYIEIKNQRSSEALAELLKQYPDDLYGLTLKTEIMRNGDAGVGEIDQIEFAEHGLKVLANQARPAGIPESIFVLQKKKAGVAFHSLLGMVAFQKHDYNGAKDHLRCAVDLDPSYFGNVYPLALAYINSDPPDMNRGLFFIARATSLEIPVTFKKKLVAYGQEKYAAYHGSEQGWKELLQMAKQYPVPPNGFTIEPAFIH